MSWEHERVEELLAAHVLDGLDGDDAALAERALEEHVPECERCRRTLDGYRTVAGDLALATPPVEPPDAVRARLRRTVRRMRRPRRIRGWLTGAAAVVAVAGLAGLAAWNFALAETLEETRLRQGWVVDAMTTLGTPGSEVVPLSGGTEARAAVMYVHGREGVYLIAARLPETEGVYRVWFVSGSKTWTPGVLETDFGTGMLPVRTSIEEWDAVLVTEEPDTDSPTPAASPVVSATVD
ncbi:MAG TPA: anti-sigma factor [Actinomycetota bacterium]|nr:anti-sigma factor [Actinomycetota bacterium]